MISAFSKYISPAQTVDILRGYIDRILHFMPKRHAAVFRGGGKSCKSFNTIVIGGGHFSDFTTRLIWAATFVFLGGPGWRFRGLLSGTCLVVLAMVASSTADVKAGAGARPDRQARRPGGARYAGACEGATGQAARRPGGAPHAGECDGEIGQGTVRQGNALLIPHCEFLLVRNDNFRAMSGAKKHDRFQPQRRLRPCQKNHGSSVGGGRSRVVNDGHPSLLRDS